MSAPIGLPLATFTSPQYSAPPLLWSFPAPKLIEELSICIKGDEEEIVNEPVRSAEPENGNPVPAPPPPP